MQAMKDHVEPANLPSGKVQVPVPDSTNGYLRRRQASNSEDGDFIWYVNTPPTTTTTNANHGRKD
jgi:hypothetical protein